MLAGWCQAGYKLQLVHRLLGLQHAPRHLIDLGRNEVGLLTIHGQLGQRFDLVLQAVQLELDHADAGAVDIYVPYVSSNEGVTFGELVAAEGREPVFAS